MSLRILGRMNARLPLDKELFLSLLGGLESGVATTTAVIVGLTISERSLAVVTVAAIVTVSIQAFNSAASRYVSLRASEEIDDLTATEKFKPLANAVVQFIAHASASIVPILPLYFVANHFVVVISTILLAYCMLVIIGGFQGIFLNVQAKQNMIEILVIGTLVILVGSTAGIILR
jgi:VIT1/CCC1 family predicted Fe2+/Mn2+ transporter